MEEDTNAILSKMNAPKAPAAKNANTRQEPRQHAPTDKNGRKDGYMYVVNENNVPVSTLVVRGEGWNKWVRELDSPDKPVDTEETPKDNGEGDSSADEEHPANRRRIEVILSRQSSPSDDDNDDAPVLGDLRDVLKQKFESENDSSPKHKDLRTMLDTRKSRRISTSDANNNKGPITELRDKLNAGACDLRIQLNHSKPTDLRRQLEQAKGHFQPPAHHTNISTDLRTLLDSKRVQTGQSLNVIMGVSPPSGDNVRSVKDYRRQVATSQKWPTKPTNHLPITFSPDDAEGVHAPHNDPLLVQAIRGHYHSISWLCPDQTLRLRTQQSLVTYAQGALTD
ncbi:hypothetical protein F2Q68_00040418 [Brassica cretica]|uniref:Uncharacterized protein n=1 Tax=Brassica cretica TaxID=69181 RepID=A0A8S9MIP3_BRACR|nr:hypothetical protein F2Q68_00040418 [Brassica cretica]